MTPAQQRKLAQEIAKDLFRNLRGKQVDRLKLIGADGRDWGGWSQSCAAKAIEKVIARNQPRKRKVKK